MSFWSIARKDLKILFRDRSAMVFIFGLPLIFTFIFGTIFSGRGGGDSSGPALKVTLVNQDTGKQGLALIRAMQNTGLSVEPETKGVSGVTERVRKGDVAVGVIIPPNFSEQIDQSVEAIRASQKPTPVALKVLTDPAQPQMTAMVQGALYGATRRVIGPLLGQQAEPPAVITLDVSSPQSAPKASVGDNIMPGFMVYFVFFMANGVAATLLNERTDGTLRRMLSAPVSRAEILVGKLLARGLMGLIQMALMFAVGISLLHLSIGSSPVGLVLTALATIFAATGLGLLIATFGKTMEQIQGMTTLALLLMGFLSGTLVPRQFLPDALQKASLITPHAWALNAYQDLILRHLPLTHTLSNIGVVLLFGIAFFGIALTRFQFE
jgi:ABC-2 type transport system permease protein